MKSRQVRNSLLLVLTAFIWGVAFVAQRQGGDAVGPFSFNGIRSLIGGAVLIPVIFIIDRIKPSDRKPCSRSDRKRLVIGGLCCGTVLFLASSAQQLGLYMGTPAGKAGFPHSVLHIAGSNSESVFEEEVWLEYMAWNSYSCGGALSALYERLTVISEQ